MTILRPAMVTILAAGTATLQARQLLITQTAQPLGKEAVTAATAGLATAFSVGSFVEFLLSPTYGKISDRFGRKPLFLSFLIGPALMRTLCVLVKSCASACSGWTSRWPASSGCSPRWPPPGL